MDESNKMMKTKELIIDEIDSKCGTDYSNYSIGFRTFPQSVALLNANNQEIFYGENCKSEKDAKEIMEHFVKKGMKRDSRFSLNIAKGIYITE